MKKWKRNKNKSKKKKKKKRFCGVPNMIGSMVLNKETTLVKFNYLNFKLSAPKNRVPFGFPSWLIIITTLSSCPIYYHIVVTFEFFTIAYLTIFWSLWRHVWYCFFDHSISNIINISGSMIISSYDSNTYQHFSPVVVHYIQTWV